MPLYSREYKWSTEPPGWRQNRNLQPFRGMIHDVRRRLPWYWSDIRDGLNYRTFAATVRMYFVKYVWLSLTRSTFSCKKKSLVFSRSVVVALGKKKRNADEISLVYCLLWLFSLTWIIILAVRESYSLEFLSPSSEILTIGQDFTVSTKRFSHPP